VVEFHPVLLAAATQRFALVPGRMRARQCPGPAEAFTEPVKSWLECHRSLPMRSSGDACKVPAPARSGQAFCVRIAEEHHVARRVEVAP
jgi:hypothetical protein